MQKPCMDIDPFSDTATRGLTHTIFNLHSIERATHEEVRISVGTFLFAFPAGSHSLDDLEFLIDSTARSSLWRVV